MQENNRETNMMKTLMNKVVKSSSVNTNMHTRIHSLISEYTRKKATKRNPKFSLMYNPILTLIIISPILLSLTLFGSFSAFDYFKNMSPEIIFVSGTAIVESRENKELDTASLIEKESFLKQGSLVKQTDTLYIPSQKECDLSIAGIVDCRLFPESSVSIPKTAPLSSQVFLALNKGSLYISKKQDLKYGKKLTVQINNYHFTLVGTRVLFQRIDKSIRIFCFDGRVNITSKDGQESRELFSLIAGENLEINIQGHERNYSIGNYLAQDTIQFDSDFRMFPAFYPEMLEKYTSLFKPIQLQKIEPLPEANDNQKPVIDEKVQEEDISEIEEIVEPEKEPFSFAGIGSIRGKTTAGKKIDFITAAHDSQKVFIVTGNNLFVLENDRLTEPVSFSETPYFKVKPVIGNKTLCLVSTRYIYLIDTQSLSITNKLMLPETGSAEDNYYPKYFKGTFYIPVLNNGYYTVEVNKAGQQVHQFYPEFFPITPLITDNEIIIGSSYINYISSINHKGILQWKYQLNGTSFSNMLRINNNLYTYVLNKNKPAIIKINKNGIKETEWFLDGKVVADFSVYQETIFGFYETGELFRLNTQTGDLKTIDKLYKNKLSAKTWRTIQPYIDKNILYAGTDNGEFFVYNITEDKIEYKLHIIKDRVFYAQPIKNETGIFLFSDDGTVYKVTKNAR